MAGILFLGLIFWLYGWTRTLALLIAVVATVIAVCLPLIVGALLSYLFWPEVVRANWHFHSDYTNWFNERMQLWNAAFLFVTFFADVFRTFTLNVINNFNVIIGAMYALMWFLLYLIWKSYIIYVFGTSRPRESEIEPDEAHAGEDVKKEYSLGYRIVAITGLMLALLGIAYVKEVYLKR